MPSALPSRDCLPATQLPQPEPSMMSHGIEYLIRLAILR